MKEFDDPYVYPGVFPPTLVNKPGIKDFHKLRTLEYAVGNVRLRELKDQPIQGKFDLDHLCTIHKHLMGDLYEWAGKTRDDLYDREVYFSKGGTLFALHSEIKRDSSVLFDALSKERHLKGYEADKEQFVERLSQYYAGLNKIHPFLEGNGRATQEFLSQLSKEAGYVIDYSKVDKTRWNLAARESAANRTGSMTDVFRDIVSPARAIAFDRLQPQSALEKYPELRSSYLVLKQAQQIAKKQFKSQEDQQRFFNLYRTRISNELHQGNEIEAPQRQKGRSR